MIVQILVHPADGVKLIVERIALLHHALGFGRVVPEIGVFGLSVQLGEANLGLVEVKGASSAARPTA
jgi:hypothetical protein